VVIQRLAAFAGAILDRDRPVESLEQRREGVSSGLVVLLRSSPETGERADVAVDQPLTSAEMET
jgi:hypothetical protein